MSDDLPARLRAQYNAWNNPPYPELPEGAGCVLEAADYIKRLREALVRLNKLATDASNDDRHTPDERFGANMVGAMIRYELKQLGI